MHSLGGRVREKEGGNCDSGLGFERHKNGQRSPEDVSRPDRIAGQQKHCSDWEGRLGCAEGAQGSSNTSGKGEQAGCCGGC